MHARAADRGAGAMHDASEFNGRIKVMWMSLSMIKLGVCLGMVDTVGWRTPRFVSHGISLHPSTANWVVMSRVRWRESDSMEVAFTPRKINILHGPCFFPVAASMLTHWPQDWQPRHCSILISFQIFPIFDKDCMPTLLSLSSR